LKFARLALAQARRLPDFGRLRPLAAPGNGG
jgi:hypothetical protein